MADRPADARRNAVLVLAQQGGSSISLFIDHFVNRRLLNWDVPTALFQSLTR